MSDQTEESYIYAVNLPDLKYSWADVEGDLLTPKIISWAKNTLKITNDKIFASSKAIVKTPWSNVLEINTGDKIVYFKQTPIDLFLEAEIIKLLCASGIKTIPKIIDDNKNEQFFLMTKCGDVNLRDYFDGNLQIDVLKQAIVCYKELQHSTVKCVDGLLAIVVNMQLDIYEVVLRRIECFYVAGTTLSIKFQLKAEAL